MRRLAGLVSGRLANRLRGTPCGALSVPVDPLASLEGPDRCWNPSKWAALPESRPHSNAAIIFDPALKNLHRERVARLTEYDDRLQNEIADRLVDRMLDCTRSFDDVLVVGGAGLVVVNKILESGQSVRSVTYAESSEKLLEDFESRLSVESSPTRVKFETVKLEENEASLASALEGKKFDCAVSCLGLHWVNDLPGALNQIKASLKPDSFFLGAILGGETLQEMRIACSVAEMERDGGVSPRVSPLARVRDAGSLLTSAAFALPVVDVDTISIRYKTAAHLVDHLRRLGESNANTSRRGFLSRDSALSTLAVYHALFAEDDATIPATFQVIYISGWTPHESQQMPMARGTATASFKDLKREIETNGGKGRNRGGDDGDTKTG